MKHTMKFGMIAGMILCSALAFGQTQLELNDSADGALKKADAELNATYKEVLASLNDASKAALKKSQVAWIKYRDLCIKSEGAQYEGGSMQPMVEMRCGAELTAEKTVRLRGMLPEAVARTKAALPAPDAQQAALKKADAKLNKVYKDFMEIGPSPPVKEAQKAWLAYRDLCAAAEATLYDKDAATVVNAKSVTELTQARTERLKGLFMETYDDEDETGAKPEASGQ